MFTGPHKSFVICGRTARRILEAPGGVLEVSLDLGLSRSSVRVEPESVELPDGARLAPDELAAAFSQPEDCVEIEDGRCRKLYFFSEQAHRYYKLHQPLEDRAPTVVIAGAAMHTIVGMDPWQDQSEKVRALSLRGGPVLDTCFGLGYSAQLLARAGRGRVVSCEVDPNVLECAAANPWSRVTFENERIQLVQGDVRDYVRGCEARSFAAIFHDPPTVHQAGELYGAELYREFARLLSPSGKLYHYVGAPGARSGKDFTRGVMQRLSQAGFTQVRRRARGLVARRSP